MTEDVLARRRAVVVGGSRGIGREVALLLAALGAGVVVNGRDDDAVAAVVAEITAGGGRAAGFAGSPSDAATAAALTACCTETFGGPDILVNCAGIPEPPGSSILTVTAAEFQAQLDSHLMTVFHSCRAVAPIMVAQGHGAIANTSSFAFLGDYGGTGYPAGKGAVNGLTLAIAAELREHGIRANVVCPGAKTRISSGPDYAQQIGALRRRGLLDEATARASLDAPPPEYAAPLYAYLVSDLARGITGQILVAAGGFVGRFDRPSPALLGYRDHADSPPWTLPELDAMIRS